MENDVKMVWSGKVAKLKIWVIRQALLYGITDINIRVNDRDFETTFPAKRAAEFPRNKIVNFEVPMQNKRFVQGGV